MFAQLFVGVLTLCSEQANGFIITRGSGVSSTPWTGERGHASKLEARKGKGTKAGKGAKKPLAASKRAPRSYGADTQTETDSAPRAVKARPRFRFVVDEAVTLTSDDEFVSRGAVGIVIGYNEDGLAEIKFPKALMFVDQEKLERADARSARLAAKQIQGPASFLSNLVDSLPESVKKSGLIALPSTPPESSPGQTSPAAAFFKEPMPNGEMLDSRPAAQFTKPFPIGAKVALTEEDEDVAPGSLGTVLSYTEEGLVEVDFPEVTKRRLETGSSIFSCFLVLKRTLRRYLNSKFDGTIDDTFVRRSLSKSEPKEFSKPRRRKRS